MNVLIKGFVMPTKREECPFCDYEDGTCHVLLNVKDNDEIRYCIYHIQGIHSPKDRPEWCPLIELPDNIDPVKHGEWIKMSDADGVYWACSECGEALPRFSHYDPQFDLFPRLKSIDKTPYCSNCGVRMDGWIKNG